jgi:6-phosphogluconolactonase
MSPRLPVFLLASSLLVAPAVAREYIALLGTYTGTGAADSRGIYAVRLDAGTGVLSPPELVAELSNPEFLALRPDGQALYALTRAADAEGRMTRGAVAAFALDTTAGVKLVPLNTEPTGRGQLCHLAVDATGREVMVAAYGDPYVASFPLQAGGRVGPVASVIIHTGPVGPNQERQNTPHAHSVTVSADNRFAFAADLGLDRVLAYRLDPATGALAPHEPPFVALPPGEGPRHTKFSPDGRFLYILNELAGTVTACHYDAARGAAEPFQRVSTLPAGYTGRHSASEIRLHPSGRFVYTANRIHNSIAVFARDPGTGALTLVENVPTGGDQPRNFNLTPDGAWLLCANQATDNLVLFKVDPDTGRLGATGRTVKVPKAVCVLFLP